MLDKIKQMLGVDVATRNDSQDKADANNSAGGNDAEGNLPLTQDEYAQTILKRLREEADSETKRFREEIEQMLNAPIPQDAQPPLQPQAQQQATEPTVELPENPTVEDLLNYVNAMVEKRLEERLRQVMASIPKIPASGVIDSIVSRHPALQTVAEEAKSIFDNLPREYQNEQTADFILWWLKGKRSEAEKKEALSELLTGGNHTQSAGNITLPYTSEQIREWAEAMGIDPKRLRQRLLETIGK